MSTTPSAYLIHSTSTCHAMAPEDQVVDPSQVLPTCGDCLDEVTSQGTAATPRPLSISMTAACAHCGQELTKTLDQQAHLVSWPWYHSATGAEECGVQA